MSFKIKNANAIIRPAHASIMILFQPFPLYPYLLAGEMTEFLRVRRDEITGEQMGLEMFAAFCAYRLTLDQRVLEFQSVNDSGDGQPTLQTTRFDLGVYEDVKRLPLAPEEVMEVVAGSLQLLNAGLGVEKDEEASEGKSNGPTPSSSLTLDVTNPSSPAITASIPETSPASPGL